MYKNVLFVHFKVIPEQRKFEDLSLGQIWIQTSSDQFEDGTG